ncbi:MAG: hypothetical protein FWD17_03855 [Polyangiaceae bacterium]|nr:hypothetical protein [Polyangiaceae bacterium]
MRDIGFAVVALLACGCAAGDAPPKRIAAPQPSSPAAVTQGAFDNRDAEASAEPSGEASDSTEWYDPAPLRASLRPDAAAWANPSNDVTLYDLDVSLMAGGNAFMLDETVWFTEHEGAPLDDVVLRVYPNAPASAAQRGAPVKFVEGDCQGQVRCAVTSSSPSVIDVKLARTLPPNGRVRIHVKLTGVLDAIDSSRTTLMAQSLESMSGLLGGGGDTGTTGDYGLLAVGDGITSLGGFYAVVARRRDGHWERQEQGLEGDLGPDAISNVRVNLAMDPGWEVATGGIVVGDKTTTDDGAPRRHLTVAAGMVREIAILTSRSFEVASADVGGVHVHSHYLAQEKDAGKKVLDAAVHSLGVFEKRFGPYPYRNLDVAEAALVGGAGGVEFSGIATVASMFYRPPGDGGLMSALSMLGAGSGGLVPGTDEMREFVTTHEVAHQWWHGLVGSDSRIHPFVDESLAQFSSILYFADRYGAARGKHAGDQNVKANYQTMRLMGEPDGAVDRPAAGTSQMAYAGLVYGKGPYFYVQLRKQLGDETFFAALRDYVKQFRFGFAGPQDFVKIAASHAGKNGPKVEGLAQRWLAEAHGDEDLGKPNLGGLLGGLAGLGDEGGPNGALLKNMMQLLQQAGGGLGGAPGNGAIGGGLLDGLLGDPPK